jgi:type I restriction enzyme S subunit
MREGWKEYSIGEIAEVIGGGTPSTKEEAFWNGNIPWITPYDLSNHTSKYISEGGRNITELGLKRSSAKLHPKNTILLTSRAPIGYIAIAQNEISTNQGFQSLICNEKLVDPNFVYYSLQVFMIKIKAIASGATFPEVSGKKVRRIKLPIPPLETQRKIASILSGYDDLIENNLKRIKILEEMAQQTYEEWFVRMRFPGYETAVMNEETGLPEGWERKISSELFKITIGKTPPRGEDEWFNSGEIENRIKWMSISDIRKSNVFLYDTKETLTREAIKKFNFNIIKKGSVALSFKLTVGLVTIASEDMTTNEAIAHFNHGKICNSYTYFYLRNFDYNTLGSTSSIGTAINSKIVKIIPFLKPNIKILNDFDSIVQPILNSINIINNQNQRLRESRDILLPRLMMGMIEV